MNKLLASLTALSIGLTMPVFSQDLSSKIPGESNIVLAINGKSFFKNIEVEQINNIFTRLGFFKSIAGANNPLNTERIDQMGIDINATSYINTISTDSVNFIGALFPLKDKNQFEALLPKDEKIEEVNGLPTIYSNDRTLRLSWDNQTLYLLGGLPISSYFKRDDVIEKYGLLSQVDNVYTSDEITEPTDSMDVTWEENEEETETFGTESEELNEVEEETIEFNENQEESEEDEYAYVDSVLERDEYQDDYYLEYRRIENHNDSIQNLVLSKWVDARMSDILSGKVEKLKSKTLRNLKDSELLRFEVQNLSDLYGRLYSDDIFRSVYGFKPAFNYGFQKISGIVALDGNQLKFVGEAEFDKATTKIYKDVYKSKVDPRFYKFLDENSLGFMSVNFNTEAYIRSIPQAIKHFMGTENDHTYADVFDLAATTIDIVLDEKAIAKVFKGDNLIVLNGVTRKDVTYTDYEYDEDYNYTEVEKTKTENVPNYLWMFSSDDTRVFEKLIRIGLREKGVIDHGGIYEFKAGSNQAITPFMLIDKGIVFLGNDVEQLESIKNGTFKVNQNHQFTKLVKRNPFVALFNTKKVPTMLQSMEIPVNKSFQKTVDELSKYGNIQLVGSKLKGNTMAGELAIEFPEGEKNALQFLVNLIDNWTLDLTDSNDEMD